jgi:hypothetical protein
MIGRRACLVQIAVLLLAPLGMSRARERRSDRVLGDEMGYPLVTESGELIGC